MPTYNFIGDTAGRFDELMALLDKMPKADKIILLGDTPDRGPKSKDLIQYCIDNQDTVEVIRGNHEILMIKSVEGESDSLDMWLYNGGLTTIASYGGHINNIPKEHIQYLKSRPLYIETEEYFLSHAPMANINWLPKSPYSQTDEDTEFTWNRTAPTMPYGNKIMFYGHNGRFKKCEYMNAYGNVFPIAYCIDDTHNKQLCGYNTETQEFYFQEFL